MRKELALVFAMNEFFMKVNYEYLLEQMGENSLESRAGRELARKKNGTYFMMKGIIMRV